MMPKVYVDGCPRIIYYVPCFFSNVTYVLLYASLDYVVDIIQIIINLGEIGLQIQLKNTGEFSEQIQIINKNGKLYTNNKLLWGII
jgi:hypothetical protein